MPEQPQADDDQKREQLIQDFSQAAARAHNKGNDAAAHGLTEAVFYLLKGKEEKA